MQKKVNIPFILFGTGLILFMLSFRFQAYPPGLAPVSNAVRLLWPPLALALIFGFPVFLVAAIFRKMSYAPLLFSALFLAGGAFSCFPGPGYGILFMTRQKIFSAGKNDAAEITRKEVEKWSKAASIRSEPARDMALSIEGGAGRAAQTAKAPDAPEGAEAHAQPVHGAALPENSQDTAHGSAEILKHEAAPAGGDAEAKPVVHGTDYSPFDYGSEELDEWAPSGGSTMLRGLKVSGIIEMEDGTAIALISTTGGSGKSFFVRQGDTIRLDPVDAYGGQHGKNSGEEVYLQIKKISGNHVETALKRRPDQLIILR